MCFQGKDVLTIAKCVISVDTIVTIVEIIMMVLLPFVKHLLGRMFPCIAVCSLFCAGYNT